MKKKVLALLLCCAMLTPLLGCNVQTKDDVQGGGSGAPSSSGVQGGAVSLKLLYSSADETVANVIRDELTKAGMTVEMSAAADGATFREQESAGNFDIAISSWANPVGTPDYGCRGIWHSNGDSNMTGISDPKLDELIVKASTETPDVYVNTYGEAERYAIEEQCYMTPLYQNTSGRGTSKVLNQDSVVLNQRWEKLAYTDPSLTDTRTLNITQTGSTITTWDCIRADDQSSGYSLDEMYIHLLTLQPDWGVSTEESLSYSYAISEDNTQYFFLLRDDCGFARIDKDGNVYDSGVKVAGEDVVYSLNRVKDPNSTPMHKTYSMYENLASVEIVTDMSVLENTKTADGKSVREVLEAEGQTIGSIVESRGDVDFPYFLPEAKYDIVEQDESLDFKLLPGIRVYMLAFNMHGNSEVSKSADLRKAIASVISYDDISAVLAGNTIQVYSTMGTCLDCGNKLNYQPGDTQKYLEAYFASKQ